MKEIEVVAVSLPRRTARRRHNAVADQAFRWLKSGGAIENIPGTVRSFSPEVLKPVRPKAVWTVVDIIDRCPSYP
jgi:hypothetical protein